MLRKWAVLSQIQVRRQVQTQVQMQVKHAQVLHRAEKKRIVKTTTFSRVLFSVFANPPSRRFTTTAPPRPSPSAIWDDSTGTYPAPCRRSIRSPRYPVATMPSSFRANQAPSTRRPSTGATSKPAGSTPMAILSSICSSIAMTTWARMARSNCFLR